MEHASVQVLEIMQLCVDAFLMCGNLMARRTVVSHLSFFSPPEGTIYFYQP